MSTQNEHATNVLRLLCAETYFLCGMIASREMYGKSYFSLGVGEKTAVDNAVSSTVFANLASITPALFGSQPQAGFQTAQQAQQAQQADSQNPQTS